MTLDREPLRSKLAINIFAEVQHADNFELRVHFSIECIEVLTASRDGGITPLLMARMPGRIPVVNACRTRNIDVCVMGHPRFLLS
jgi:hypothetical protein